MYVQCYDRNGNRHNFNVTTKDRDYVVRHLTNKGYVRVTFAPFAFVV